MTKKNNPGRIHLSLGEESARKLDYLTRLHGLTRTGVVRFLINQEMRRMSGGPDIESEPMDAGPPRYR